MIQRVPPSQKALHEAGALVRRAKLRLQVDRLIGFGGRNVEHQIARRELRRGRADGLRECSQAESNEVPTMMRAIIIF